MPSRTSPKNLEAASQTVDAIGEMTDYKPFDKNLEHAALVAARDAMQTAQAAEDAAKRQFDQARDAADLAERNFNQLVTNAKTAVKGQYGADSAQVQAVGLKRKSEIARGRRAKPDDAQNTAK